MSTHDKSGRPWAKLSELKPMTTVTLDSGFDCMSGTKVVKFDKKGYYVECTEGHHYLDGHADDGEHLIGIYGPL